MNNKTRTPLFHVARRASLPWYKSWAIRGAALLLALLVCSIVTIVVTGENPLRIFSTMSGLSLTGL